MTPPRPYTSVDEFSSLRRAAARVGRNWRWLREQGWQAVADEHNLHVSERVENAMRRWAWKREHGAPGRATPVFVVGVQRSGTNMVVRGLARVPDIQVRSENDRRAFARYKLRSDSEVRRLVDSSPYRIVLLKPLCDSHRTDHLLDHLGTNQPGKAIWVYRGMEGRVRSALAKFGDVNVAVLRDFANGIGFDRWQVQRLSSANEKLVRSFDYDDLSPASGAALFWYLRNSLYFDQALDCREDVMLLDYDRLLADPVQWSTRLADFMGIRWDPTMVSHVRPGANGHREPLDIHPEIRKRCDELEERLAAVEPIIN